MIVQLLVPLVPSAVAVLLALAAYLRARAAHSKIDDHQEFAHQVFVRNVRKGPAAPDDQ